MVHKSFISMFLMVLLNIGFTVLSGKALVSGWNLANLSKFRKSNVKRKNKIKKNSERSRSFLYIPASSSSYLCRIFSTSLIVEERKKNRDLPRRLGGRNWRRLRRLFLYSRSGWLTRCTNEKFTSCYEFYCYAYTLRFLKRLIIQLFQFFFQIQASLYGAVWRKLDFLQNAISIDKLCDSCR